jgi:hypothetical protein
VFYHARTNKINTAVVVITHEQAGQYPQQNIDNIYAYLALKDVLFVSSLFFLDTYFPFGNVF